MNLYAPEYVSLKPFRFFYEFTNCATGDETSGQMTDYMFVKSAFICVVELQGRWYVELNTILNRLQDGNNYNCSAIPLINFSKM